MAKHWIRDVIIPAAQPYFGNCPEANLITYNFLRCAGWDWVWECDGEITADSSRNPNHVPDGNMETAGVTNWTVVAGGTRSKVTTPVQSGLQALRVVASAPGDGVRSDALTTITALSGGNSGSGVMAGPNGRGEMDLTIANAYFTPADLGSYVLISGSSQPTNNGKFLITRVLSTTRIMLLNPAGVAEGYTSLPPFPYTITLYAAPKYELVFQARNSQTWTVEVDPGTGVFASVGTIPASGGAYVQHHFEFNRPVGGGGSVYVRFVASAADTLYLDSMFAYRSYWENNGGLWKGTDGIITAPDKFSTAGSYTLTADDVGWHVFIWDPTNNKNSGCYKITAVAVGVATLDLRSGTAALVAASGLTWRLIHLTNSASTGDVAQRYSGFGLQSPHTSNWRLFFRQNEQAGSNYKGTQIWAAPEDTDFDTSTGAFYLTGPSTQRLREGKYYATNANSVTDMHLWGCIYDTVAITTRTFLMVEDDGSFVTFAHYDTTSGYHGCVFAGYTGADSDHPDVEEFALLARWENPSSSYSEIDFKLYAASFGYAGTGFTPEKLAISVGTAVLGYTPHGTSGEATFIEEMSNAGPNPWSGKEWIRPLIIWRDKWMNGGCPSMRLLTNGLFQTRKNMTSLTTFDSNAYIHFAKGLCWEWSGEAII